MGWRVWVYHPVEFNSRLQHRVLLLDESSHLGLRLILPLRDFDHCCLQPNLQLFAFRPGKLTAPKNRTLGGPSRPHLRYPMPRFPLPFILIFAHYRIPAHFLFAIGRCANMLCLCHR
jgi:hypothetical protein